MRTDEAARRGMERRRGWLIASQFLPHRLNHFEPMRNLFQRLRDVFAQLGKGDPRRSTHK